MEAKRRERKHTVFLIGGVALLGAVAFFVARTQLSQQVVTAPASHPASTRSELLASFKPRQRAAAEAPRFSAESYAKDPNPYLAQVAPGRAFQLRSPEPGLAAIQPASPLRPSVKPLRSVELSVKAAAGAPVTFTSVGLGAFQNGRTSITVASDSAGVARASFTAIRGTVGRAMVYAASPAASGQARFTVEIEKPELVTGNKATQLP